MVSGSFLSCGGETTECEPELLRPYVAPAMETDTRFLVLDDGQVIFSANTSQSVDLFRFDGHTVHKLDSSKDLRFPFLFDGKIAGLRDKEGDEKWQASEEVFVDFFPSSPEVQSVFSFQEGKLLVVQMRDDPSLYLLDIEKEKKSRLLHRINQLHHVEFSEEGGFFIVNADDRLLYFDREGESFRVLFQVSDGHKLNPYIFNDLVYFASNEGSEFFKLYAIHLNLPAEDPTLILETAHDLRLPKRYGKDLFYIEIVAGEYILKRKDVETGSIESITSKGVVYDFSLYGEDQLVVVYSDFFTPKMLFLYEIKTGSISAIIDNTVELPITYRFIPASTYRSSAYELFPLDSNSIRGVILFFHPGLRGDFSPRWDSVLANLVNNGFRIIAPNYPMSFGFGKIFNKADFSEGSEDMVIWTNYLVEKHGDVPLYALSASSGNILMEHVLEERSNKFAAAASLFALPAFDRFSGRVPHLLIAGENDPIVLFSAIRQQIKASGSNRVGLISYPDEGHWFRKSTNAEHAVRSILNHYCANK